MSGIKPKSIRAVANCKTVSESDAALCCGAIRDEAIKRNRQIERALREPELNDAKRTSEMFTGDALHLFSARMSHLKIQHRLIVSTPGLNLFTVTLGRQRHSVEVKEKGSGELQRF